MDAPHVVACCGRHSCYLLPTRTRLTATGTTMLLQPRHIHRGHCVSAGAKPGDFVSVEYTGTLESGEVFDTSRKEGRGPLEFVVGGGRMIKGFDRAVTGLEVGQSRKVAVPPAEA